MSYIVSFSKFNFSFTAGTEFNDCSYSSSLSNSLQKTNSFSNSLVFFFFGMRFFHCSSNKYTVFISSLERSRNTSIAENRFNLDNLCVASTIIDLEQMMPFSTAIDTVLPINRFNFKPFYTS